MSPDESRAIIKANLAAVRARIEAACRRVGRRPAEVKLIAVTKYVGPEVVEQLHQLGCEDFGESRPQELWRKAAAAANAKWHLVGPLQTNKIRRTLPLVSMIHSIDRWELANELSREALRQGLTVRGLVEVKLTREAGKHGFDAAELRQRLSKFVALPGVVIEGLMGMAAADADESASKTAFHTLKTLRDDLRTVDHPLEVLSMGMSGDFEIAVEEGATHVRIGSALFDGLPTA